MGGGPERTPCITLSNTFELLFGIGSSLCFLFSSRIKWGSLLLALSWVDLYLWHLTQFGLGQGLKDNGWYEVSRWQKRFTFTYWHAHQNKIEVKKRTAPLIVISAVIIYLCNTIIIAMFQAEQGKCCPCSLMCCGVLCTVCVCCLFDPPGLHVYNLIWSCHPHATERLDISPRYTVSGICL